MCPATPGYDPHGTPGCISRLTNTPPHLSFLPREQDVTLGLSSAAPTPLSCWDPGGGCKGPFALPPLPVFLPGPEVGAAPALTMLSSCCWYLCSGPVLPEDRTCPFFGFQLGMDEPLGIQREFPLAPSWAAATEGGQNEPWLLGSASWCPGGQWWSWAQAHPWCLQGSPGLSQALLHPTMAPKHLMTAH